MGTTIIQRGSVCSAVFVFRSPGWVGWAEPESLGPDKPPCDTAGRLSLCQDIRESQEPASCPPLPPTPLPERIRCPWEAGRTPSTELRPLTLPRGRPRMTTHSTLSGGSRCQAGRGHLALSPGSDPEETALEKHWRKSIFSYGNWLCKGPGAFLQISSFPDDQSSLGCLYRDTSVRVGSLSPSTKGLRTPLLRDGTVTASNLLGEPRLPPGAWRCCDDLTNALLVVKHGCWAGGGPPWWALT